MTGTPLDLDLGLLADDHDFVRRLAHSLVFDRDRRDDAVQDAWLAAMRRPPRTRAAVSTWFHHVLQNGLRRRTRDDARRRHREQLAARPEALPSAAEVAAREQQRQRVVAAVLALPEPYRGTVLARYFDDQSPKAIARRCGLPAATVRSHLHRGLEMLRARLDDDHRGDRRAWCVTLLPLLRPTGAGMGSVFGALLMSKGVAVGAIIALGLLSLLWLRGDTPLEVPAPVIATNAAPAASSAVGDSNAAMRSGDTNRTAAAAPTIAPALPALAGLRGRIVDRAGRARPDALVRVLGLDTVSWFADMPDRGEHRGPELPRGEARTDIAGNFVVEGLAASCRYLVHADADGDDRTLLLADATPGPGQIVDLGDLVVTEKGRLRGRAVDDDGAPVAGAAVFAIDLPASLAAMLPFERLDPANGGMLAVRVPAATGADLDATRKSLRSFLGSQLLQRADLDRRDDTMTLVLDRLPWAERAFAELPCARTVTAADGTFVLRGVEPGGNLLALRRHGRCSTLRPRVVVHAGDEQDLGDVVLEAGETVSGTVRSATGAPLAGAEVRVAAVSALGYRGLAFAEAPVFADRDGRFAVAGMPRGRVLLAARARAGEAWFGIGPLAVDDDVELRQPPGHELRVQLRGCTANARDAAIEFCPGPPLGELQRLGMQPPLSISSRLRWLDDTTFALADLPPGCGTLRIDAPGAAPQTTIVVLPATAPLEIDLAVATPFLLSVRDADGHPVAGARVHVHRPFDNGDDNVLPTDYGLPRWRTLPRLAGASNERGELAIAARPAGALTVVVTHPDWSPATLAVEATATSAAITLARPGRLQGRLSERGRAADPARWVVVAHREAIGAMPATELRSAIAADGSFAFDGLAAGPWRVAAATRRGAPITANSLVETIRAAVSVFFDEASDALIEHDVAIAAGATTDFAFDADPNAPGNGPAAQLSGRASIDGRPLAGAELRREIDHFRNVAVCIVGVDGTFVVPAIAAGNHEFSLVENGTTLWRGDVAMPADSAVVLDLAWRTGQLSGRVAFADGSPLAAGMISATAQLGNGRVDRSSMVAKDGTFTFADLPAGDYRVQAVGFAASGPEVPVHVDAGASASAQLRVDAHCVLRGRIEVGTSGGDLYHAYLVLRNEQQVGSCFVDADGTFAVSTGGTEGGIFDLELHSDDAHHRIEPARVELAPGQTRTIVVRVLGPVSDRR